jgi:dipeptidyl aminopeptidase/acylaminoacyl peptidase
VNRIGSALSYVAAFVVLTVVLGVCMGAWSLTQPVAVASPTPDAGWVMPSAQPPVTPSPTPAPTLGPDALRVSALGSVPDEARFVALGDIGDERLLLLDPARRSVVQVAHFEGLGVAGPDRQLEITASADGSTVVLLSEWDAANNRLIVVRPATGEVRAFSIPASAAPRLSPDGRTIAVTRFSDPSQRGIWLIDVADGRSSRIAEDEAGRTASRPIGWSRDGKRLAIVLDANGTEPTIAILEPGSSGIRVAGPGRNARWRGDELLLWSEQPGSGVTVYDATTGATRPAFPAVAGTVTQVLEPRPGTADIATREHRTNANAQVLLRGSQATPAVLLSDANFLIAMWWTRDARHLYAWTTSNGTETISDLMEGAEVLQFCRRQKVSPPCP